MSSKEARKQQAIDDLVTSTRTLIAQTPAAVIARVLREGLRQSGKMVAPNKRGGDAKAGMDLFLEDLEGKTDEECKSTYGDLLTRTVQKGDAKMVLVFCQSTAFGIEAMSQVS